MIGLYDSCLTARAKPFGHIMQGLFLAGAGRSEDLKLMNRVDRHHPFRIVTQEHVRGGIVPSFLVSSRLCGKRTSIA